MDTAIGTFQAHKEAAFTPKLGEVRPIDISSHGRRELDEKTVADLVETLRRDGRFLHPIAVRKGETQHRLIAGHHRVEASKRCFGEQAPISAIIYPPDTPGALIAIFEYEENLLRKELTAAERERQTILLAAALKQLDREKLATELPVLGSDAKSATRGGRGKKAMTARLADQLRLTKPAVQKRINQASAAIGEKINLDRDPPEELERKAEKRRHAESKLERPKHRKREPQEVVDDEEFDSGIEEVWKALSALDRNAQAKIILRACRSHGWGLRMGPRWRVPAVDEEPAVALPAEVAPANDDAAVNPQAEERDDAAELGAEDLQIADADGSEGAEDGAAEDTDHNVSDAVDQEDSGAENLHDADDAVAEAADQESADANLDAEHLQDAGVGSSEAADPEPGGAVKCAYCTMPFEGGDECVMIYGRPYHADLCAEFAKPIAIAA